MAEFMTGLKRTHYCGDLRISDVGKEVTVCGWVQRCRDLGQLIFIDLRDRTGVVQLAFNDKTDKEIFDNLFLPQRARCLKEVQKIPRFRQAISKCLLPTCVCCQRHRRLRLK